MKTCLLCKKRLDNDCFEHKDRVCLHCRTFKKCNDCEEEKIIGKEINLKSFFCFECIKKRRKNRVELKKKKSWERVCPDCGAKVITTIPRATIVYCDECRAKKKEIRKQAKLKVINEIKLDYCQICKIYTPNNLRKHRTIVCHLCRHKMKEFKQSCFIEGKYFKNCRKCDNQYEVHIDFWSSLYCEKCTHIEPYVNLRIHKFGYQGVCSDGHRYTSLNEQDFDEWLLQKDIEHIVQPRLKPTYRHSDFFLPRFSKHIEIDGLEREDDIDWYGKLSVYEKLGMKQGKDFLILKPVSKHFIEDKIMCFSELDSVVLPLLVS